MILPIVKYGHPVLRRKGAPIVDMTPDVLELIQDMLETMYDAAGVGLAAPQVGRPLQLTVLDVRAAENRPSTLELKGQPSDVAAFMPLTLINPVVKASGDPVPGPEGCLSFPEIYADILRPPSVEVTALNAAGDQIEFKAGGLLARAIQHEVDHLNGILFIDRMTIGAKAEVEDALKALQAATKASVRS